VSTPEQLAAQAQAVAAVRAARVERDRVVTIASATLRRAIMAALDTGASVRNVAVAAGVTPQRIYQLMADER
jgi:hypothetical protein